MVTREIKAEQRSKRVSWGLWLCASWFHFHVSPGAFLLSLSSPSSFPPGRAELGDLPAWDTTCVLEPPFFQPPNLGTGG